MPSDLTRGAYSGKETFLYYNSATYASPTWVEIPRARNISVNDGPGLADVEFHGSENTSQIPGYKAFNGSLEYVRRRTTASTPDGVYDYLKAASENGTIVDMMHLNQDIVLADGTTTNPDAIGWRAPCILGQFAETANGGDPVVASLPFSLADAYDASGDQIARTPYPVPTP